MHSKQEAESLANKIQVQTPYIGPKVIGIPDEPGGPATNGLIRENVPSNVSKRFLPASFTTYSYCAFSNDSWGWQGTKPGPRGSAPSKSKSSTPKP